MKKYLAIIIAVILFAVLIQMAYGEVRYMNVQPKTPSINGTESIPYYIDNDFFMDRNQPVVCLHESPSSGYDRKVYEEITKQALENWTDKLYEKTGGHKQWYLHYVFVEDSGKQETTLDYKYCDINIMFTIDTPLNISTGSYVKGGTWHYVSANHWSDIKVFTWEYETEKPKFDNSTNVWKPQFKALLAVKEVSQQVLEHELGHAFGLKHHELDGKMYINGGAYDYEHAEKSMMYYATSPYYDENKQIRDIDIDAIISKYGTDGWGGWTDKDIWVHFKQ